MIYAFRLPTINPHMSGARIECLYAQPGDALKMGSKLLDLGVDLSSAFAQECPPVSYFRVVLREPVILREFKVQLGEYCEVGQLIALFSTTTDEDLNAESARDIRTATAGIIHHDGLWSKG